MPFSVWRIAVPAYGPTVLHHLGQGAVVPVIALSARSLGASVGSAAFLVAVLGIGQFIGALPAGALVARVGERRALLAASVVTAVAWTAGFAADALWGLATTVFVAGLAGAVFGLARQAYVTEVVPVEYRARALSTLGGVGRIGLFLGPFLGAAVVHLWGIGSAYLVGAAGALGSAAVLLCTRDLVTSRPPSDARRVSLFGVLREHRHTFLTLGSGVFAIAVARAARDSLLPLWADQIGIGAAQTSIVFGIAGGIEMLLFYPAGMVMDRFGRVWVAVPTVLLLGAGMAGLPLVSSVGGLAAVAGVMALGSGIGSGIVKTLGADAAPPDERARFLGGWTFCAELGGMAGPLVISAVSVVAPLAVAAGLLGAVAVGGGGWLARWVPRFDPRFRVPVVAVADTSGGLQNTR